MRVGPWLAMVVSIVPMLAWAWPTAADEAPPKPYFVSLGAGEVNLRTGPGVRYPIEWVYMRRALPVEVIGRFDQWRQIRDWQGTEGWVHQSMLSTRRTIIVIGETRLLRADPVLASAAIARLEPGAIGEIADCSGDWCKVAFAGHRGWLGRDEFWGSHPGDTVE
jgi:SH3-like domain-containing protein